MADTVTVTGPDGSDYEFPAGTTKDTAITYFRSKSAPAKQGYTPQSGDANISASPTGAGAWLNNLESDFRYGTDRTMPGRMLKAMGAQGINVGSQAGAADSTLATPVLGPIHAAQGIAETPDHPIRGPLKTLGGALETMTLPASFVAPEANMGLDKIPSRDAAGKVLGQVKDAIGDNPVNIQNVIDAAKKAQQFSSRGGGPVPDVIKKFMARIGKSTFPYASDSAPLTFEEARDFYSNATSKLTADEAQKLKPIMLKHLAEFTNELGGNVQQVADSAGYGDQFSGAMKEFRRASQLVSGAKAAAKLAVGGSALGGTYYGVNQLIQALSRGGR